MQLYKLYDCSNNGLPSKSSSLKTIECDVEHGFEGMITVCVTSVMIAFIIIGYHLLPIRLPNLCYFWS